jgi:zinc/manganese transport system ATP-binding protein
MSALVRFHNLTLGYDRHPAVHHLTGEINAGSLIAVVGPNGAGKSSLLKGIAGELSPMQGQLELQGIKRRDIAWLTQQSTLDASFPIQVFDLVSAGLWRRTGAFGGVNRTARTRIEEALSAVGLTGLEQRPIGTLSGGQLQRARFARLMLQDAPLLLLDEPYAAIDTATANDLAALVARWHAEGRTVVSVLHDLDHVRAAYPEAMLLSRELIARGAPAEVLSAANLDRARMAAQARDADLHSICHEGDAAP